MDNLDLFFADLHVHVGRDGAGRPVKISAAPGMTVEAVLTHCQHQKGIDIVAIVDTASPGVQQDIKELVDGGKLAPLPGGGLRYADGPVLIPAIEVEIGDEGTGPAHFISYFPDMDAVKEVSRILADVVTNIGLSTQKARLRARELLSLTVDNGGIFVPAHVFTPHKGYYGAMARRLPDVFGGDADRIAAIELGLSADTEMADRIDELASRTFLSSSDAHSLPKIAREYTVLQLAQPSFAEFAWALAGTKGRRVTANYGLHPLLGKYHRTACVKCERIATEPPPVLACPQCGGTRITKGVLDRLTEIADYEQPAPVSDRPPYVHQVPLEFVPGVGPKTLAKLLDAFGSEMAVLHEATAAQLATCVGEHIAERVVHARTGQLALQSGGGGSYGRVQTGESPRRAKMAKIRNTERRQ